MTMSNARQTVVFVGLGAIGLPMAMQLLRAGYDVIGIDISADRRSDAQRQGLRAVETLTEAPVSSVAIVMAATPSQVLAITTDDDGLFDHLSADSTCIVMSTVGPAGIECLIEPAARSSIRLIDAPVSGGVSGAESANLVIFAAGNHNDVIDARDVLGAMGNVRHCGNTPGNGQSLKLVNQLLCSVHLVAAAESLSFASRLGLDPAAVLDMVNQGSGASWMLTDRGPDMIADPDSNSEVATALDIFVKDSRLVAQAARQIGFTAPLLTAASSAFDSAAAIGLGRLGDFRVKDIYD